MTDKKDKFRSQTKDVLSECARWLEGHADELATKFAGDEIGCQSWSLSFSYNADGFHGVIVNTKNKCIGVVTKTVTNGDYY